MYINKEKVMQYDEQLKIAGILLKDEKDLTENEIKKAQEFFSTLEMQNNNSNEYTLEEFENMVNKKIEKLENEKIQNKNRKNSLAIHKSTY